MAILPAAGKAIQKAAALRIGAEDSAHWTAVEARLWLMLVIFLVSLFAASFPALARRTPGLRVHPVFFFIGRHFGTGVILSTAFAHLLQDAFAALQNPQVRERWRVGEWAGFVVLASLLSIFLVEYISTAFVDRLHSYPSAPPSPLPSPTHSPSRSSSRSVADVPRSSSKPLGANGAPGLPLQAPSPPPESVMPAIVVERQNDEQTSLVVGSPSAARPRRHTYGSTSRAHRGYAQTFPRAAGGTSNQGAQDADGEIFFAGGHHRHETRGEHATHHGDSLGGKGWRAWFRTAGGDTASVDGSVLPVVAVQNGAPARKREEHARDRARSHTAHSHGHGHGHTHLDMESWNPEVEGTDEDADEEDEQDTQVGRRRQIVGILMLQIGIMLHSLVIGLTLAITSGPEFTSLVVAIIFHQLFEGLSLGIRIASLPASSDSTGKRSVLKPVLAFCFAITTPVGIAVGLGVFGPGRSEGAKLLLIQGLMSALSAGMLIYAACVEMLAGDFIMDPHLWRASVGRQALALGSLFAGVAAMALVGMCVLVTRLFVRVELPVLNRLMFAALINPDERDFGGLLVSI